MKCDYCGGPNPNQTGCVRCGKASYCSQRCAMQDWAKHEKMCDAERRRNMNAQSVDVRIGPIRIGKDTYEHALGSLFSLLAKDGKAHDTASAEAVKIESKIKRVIGDIGKKMHQSVAEIDDAVMAIHKSNRNKDRGAVVAGLKGMLQMLMVHRMGIAYDANRGAENIAEALLRRDQREAKLQGSLIGRMLDKK